MHIAKGTSRFVVCFPRLKLVLKFPIIYLMRGLRYLPHYLRRFERLRQIKIDSHGHQTPLSDFGRGIWENWKEWRFFRKTRHSLLQTTYLSFFGLLNIQKYDPQVDDIGFDIFRLLVTFSNPPYELLGRDMHHWRTGKNFSRDDSGKLLIFDYGTRQTQAVVLAYGKRLREEFVFPAKQT